MKDQATTRLHLRSTAIFGLIAAAALYRIVPHPPNFSPIMAMALFGGASLADRRMAFLIPLGAMLVSDLALGFSLMTPIVYAVFVLMTLLGMAIRKRRTFTVILSCVLTGSIGFFLVTNFAVWGLTNLYPTTLAGLMACYMAGLPFFQSTLLGDLFFSGALFFGLALMERAFPILRELPVTGSSHGYPSGRADSERQEP